MTGRIARDDDDESSRVSSGGVMAKTVEKKEART